MQIGKCEYKSKDHFATLLEIEVEIVHHLFENGKKEPTTCLCSLEKREVSLGNVFKIFSFGKRSFVFLQFLQNYPFFALPSRRAAHRVHPDQNPKARGRRCLLGPRTPPHIPRRADRRHRAGDSAR